MAKSSPRGSAAGAAQKHAPVPEPPAPATPPDSPLPAIEEEQVQAPDPAEEIEATATPDNYEQQMLSLIPMRERHKVGALLFAEACYIYGIDPNPEKQPTEILGPWKFYPGNPQLTPPVPDRIKFVTAGGTKVVHPMDDDFEDKLRDADADR
jgi:hypothetical protein